MSETINKSIQKIANGSYLMLIGTVLNLFLGLVIKILFARFATQSEYGMYSLVITIIGILTAVSTLGLSEGATKYIAYFRGKNQKQNIQDIIFSSIIIGSIASSLSTITLFTTSHIIATKIFSIPAISQIIKVTSLTIPFVVLTNIFITIFRGFEKAEINVYINVILKNGLYCLLLSTVVLLKLSFIEMIYVYIISTIVTGIIVIAYFIKAPPIKINWSEIRINYITRELLLNSVPLLIVNILLLIMSWTDTLMLGYFKPPDVVGAYNAAYPLAHLLSIVVSSIGFLYLPVISQLYSKNQIRELKIISATSTKWCFILTLPIFFMLFIFPSFILNLFFGSSYIGVSETLQILAFGCILDSYFGFNYYTLLSAGKSKLLLCCSLASATLNIILNYILIPPYGTIGAAIASVFSFALIEVYMTVRLYRLIKYHPFTNSYLKVTLISILLIYVFYFVKDAIILSIWSLILYFLLFLFIYFISLILTHSLNQNDLEILKFTERKIKTTYQNFKNIVHE